MTGLITRPGGSGDGADGAASGGGFGGGIGSGGAVGGGSGGGGAGAGVVRGGGGATTAGIRAFVSKVTFASAGVKMPRWLLISSFVNTETCVATPSTFSLVRGNASGTVTDLCPRFLEKDVAVLKMKLCLRWVLSSGCTRGDVNARRNDDDEEMGDAEAWDENDAADTPHFGTGNDHPKAIANGNSSNLNLIAGTGQRNLLAPSTGGGTGFDASGSAPAQGKPTPQQSSAWNDWGAEDWGAEPAVDATAKEARSFKGIEFCKNRFESIIHTPIVFDMLPFFFKSSSLI